MVIAPDRCHLALDKPFPDERWIGRMDPALPGRGAYSRTS
jgi:hypothetical protein